MKAYEDATVAKAADWVTTIGEGMFVNYGCCNEDCKWYPLQHRGWWRLHWKGHNTGGSWGGKGQWRCAVCLQQWTRRKGARQRAFIIGSPSDPYVFMAYLGDITPQQELQLGILKTGRLLPYIGNREPTKLVLLEAIHALNELCDRRLGDMVPTETLTAKDPTLASSVPIYCEDPALSLQHVGQCFRAFRMVENAPVLAPEDVDILFGFAASFLDMNSMQHQGRKHKQAWQALQA